MRGEAAGKLRSVGTARETCYRHMQQADFLRELACSLVIGWYPHHGVHLRRSQILISSYSEQLLDRAGRIQKRISRGVFLQGARESLFCVVPSRV